MSLPLDFGEVVERLRRSTVLIGDRRGSGSGVIIDPEGAVVTNAHVVRSSARVRVQLWDGRTCTAEAIAHDQSRDLALLALPLKGLPAASLANSTLLRPGALVLAVGNPLGFIGALTTGIVHAVGPVPGLGAGTWIQSDLHLAPGNSGGPLADARGAVVGINTMIIQDLGLALPAAEVVHYAALERSRAHLGILARQVRLSINGRVQMGLVILEVRPGGAADVASMLPGDIIIGAGDHRLQTMEDLESVLLGDREQRPLALEFLRGDRMRIRRATVLLQGGHSRAA